VPTTHRANFPRKILLATDLSSRCDRAFDRAVALAVQWDGSLVVAHALERDVGRPSKERRESVSRRATQETVLIAQQQVREDLLDRDIPFEVYIEEGDPVEIVLKVVREAHCELIVTGIARSETFGRILLGATVEHLARQAPTPILAVKTRPRDPYKEIVVATDFSEASRSALDRASELFPDAAMTLVHCHRPILGDLSSDSQTSPGRQIAQQECEEFLHNVPPLLRQRLKVLIAGDSLENVVDGIFADRGLDLLVMGSKGRGAIAHALLGSTADRLLRSSRSDVMIVPKHSMSSSASEYQQ